MTDSSFQPPIPEPAPSTRRERATAWLGRIQDRLHPHRRWLPVLSFAAGVLSFALLERGTAVARTLPLMLIAGWVVLLMERTITRAAARWLSEERSREAIHFVLQGIHQESFFFALPFLIGSTSWWTTEALFSVAVVAAAVLSVLDPVYFGFMARHGWILLSYHAFSLFIAMLVALPLLFGLDSTWSLALAAALAAGLAVPSLRGFGVLRSARGWAMVMALAGGFAALAWAGRRWVPPAPLRLVDAGISHSLDAGRRKPGPYLETIAAPDLLAGGLVAYTPIRAPLGLKDKVEHVWLHKGREIDRIPLVISGGRERGYRTWSRKRNFPAVATGPWTVEVRTHYGQRIGILRFVVTAPRPTDPATPE